MRLKDLGAIAAESFELLLAARGVPDAEFWCAAFGCDTNRDPRFAILQSAVSSSARILRTVSRSSTRSQGAEDVTEM